MATLSINMKTLMSSAQINASELARRTGIAQPIIHRLSTGQNVNPKLATIKPIARYFMVTVSQLIGEEPLPADAGDGETRSGDATPIRVSTQHKGWNQVPLITWEDALVWPERLTEYKNSIECEYVPTDANVSNVAYSLRVQGSNMEPLFPEGTKIIIEPNRQPQDRDFVVVRMNGSAEAQIKQIVIQGEQRFLKSIVPAAGTHEQNLLGENDKFLGVMAQAKVDF